MTPTPAMLQISYFWTVLSLHFVCPIRDKKLRKAHWFVWFISICSGWVQAWSQMNWFPQRWWWDACERMFISSSFVRLIMLNQLKYLRKYNERKMNKMSDDRTGFISFSIFDKLEFCWLKQWEDQVVKYNQNLIMIGPAGPPKMRSPYGFNSYRVLGYRVEGWGVSDFANRLTKITRFLIA